MPAISICPATFDMFVCQGDELPWTFTLLSSSGEPIDLTGYGAITLVVDELEMPVGVATQVFSLIGTVVSGPDGTVEFELSSLQAQTAVGRYFYNLYVTDTLTRTYVASKGRFTFVDSCETNMITDVDICNMALSFIGDAATVRSINPPDTSAQARLCKTFYPIAVRSTLEMHNWAFATKRTECDPVTPPAEGEHGHVHGGSETCDCSEWKYYYALPRHFLKAIAVLPPDSVDDYKQSSEFTVQVDSTGVLRLYTNIEDAVLLYTEYVVDPYYFPPLFQVVVAWHLAGMLAGPIMKGDVGAQESKRCLQMMAMYMGRASKSDSDVRKIDTKQYDAGWIQGR